VQSLILGAVLFNAAMVLAALGVLGDLLSSQRITLQRIFERVRRVELELEVPPSHYEPGQPAADPHADHGGAAPVSTARAHRGARGASGMSHAVTRDAEGTVTGNTYDKYGSTNPVVKRLMAGSSAPLDELFTQAAPQSLLDVGCGEGGAHLQVGGSGSRPRPRGRDRPRGPRRSRPSGAAQGAQPRVPDHEGRAAAVRRRRVRRGAPRSRCSSTCPTRHTVAEMARVASVAPARLRPREPLWRGPEHGPRRVPQGPRQHARPRQPLVQALVRVAAGAPRRGRRGALAVPVDDAARRL
jgi:hypothetical protein